MASVAICVVTYLRPKGLVRLLTSLAQLRFVKSVQPELTIVVVDNDPEGSARAVVQEASTLLPCSLRYEIEERRGISFVRNRAITLAGAVDYIAFIDDDEAAHASWLDELLRVQCEYRADIVTGPVIPQFEIPPPRWIVQGRFFERPRQRTGSMLAYARTGNVLIRRFCLSQIEGPFHEFFALVGGEDTHLFMRLHRQGARIVWADEAVVDELIPLSRMSASWLLLRAYRDGNSIALCERLLESSGFLLPIRVGKACFRIGQGLALLLPSLLVGRARAVRALSYVSRGVGALVALSGSKFEEYRSIHGE